MLCDEVRRGTIRVPETMGSTTTAQLSNFIPNLITLFSSVDSQTYAYPTFFCID